jgi:hypothetical protein
LSTNGIKYHTDADLTRATAFKSSPEEAFGKFCERCGRTLRRKGKRGTAADGLSLCGDCRAVDPGYRLIRMTGRFIETSDGDLAALMEEAS